MTRLNKFMVYNPKKGKPIKYYKDYFSANQDAEILSKKENTSVLVLKVVTIARPIMAVFEAKEYLLAENKRLKSAIYDIENCLEAAFNPVPGAEIYKTIDFLQQALKNCKKVRGENND